MRAPSAIPAGKRVTLRVVFPRDVLDSVAGLKVEKKAGLASILAERRTTVAAGGPGRSARRWSLLVAQRRRASYSAIAPAAATLSDSLSGASGIVAAEVAPLEDVGREPFALGPEHERRRLAELELGQRRPDMRGQPDPRPRRVVEARERHAEDRARGRAQRLRPGRIGAAGRERDARAERVGGAQQRPDVSRIADVPERERQRQAAARKASRR